MILRTCTLNEFEKRTRYKTVICFGAGRYIDAFSADFPDIEWNVSYFVDNNRDLWGQKKVFRGISYDVHPPSFLLGSVTEDTVVIITTGIEVAMDIFAELESSDKLKTTECYLAPAVNAMQVDCLSYNAELPPEGFRMNKQPAIPKKIHYTWLGNDEMPDFNRKCIESWRKFCPDYEIVEWNKTNYDITKSQYMREAYEAEKWGFAADYARLDIIYEYGGIYLDVDVELVKPLDELLYNNAFCGFHTSTEINFGSGFGAVKHFPLLLKMIERYKGFSFLNHDGTYNLKTGPTHETEIATDYDLLLNGNFQIIDGMTVYPSVFFAPLSPMTLEINSTEDTYSIHWYDSSWFSQSQHELKRKWRELLDKANDNEGGSKL
jgi:mannosyltransferase OCH1-like enzyme